MREKFARSSGLVAAIAVALLLIATPGVAASSLDRADDHLDSNPCQKEAPVPLCCSMADCALSPCILASAVKNEALLPNRSVTKVSVSPAWSPTSLTAETPLSPRKPFRRYPTRELPSCPGSESHCRDCLISEEPPQS